MSLHTRPLSDAFGVEVLGVDLARDLDAGTIESLREIWREIGVLCFRDADVTPRQLLALGRVFGEPELHPFTELRFEDVPEVSWLSNEDKEAVPVFYKAGQPLNYVIPWHTDLTYQDVPSRGNLIRSITVPPEGGETGLIDMIRVYEQLPTALKSRVDDLEIVFRFTVDPTDMKFNRDPELVAPTKDVLQAQRGHFPVFPDKVHPLVVPHPDNGRKVLNLSPYNAKLIPGLPEAESDALLQELIDFATQPEFAYFHRWCPNEILVFDNLRVMHSVKGVPPQHSRVMHRIGLLGTRRTGRTYDA